MSFPTKAVFSGWRGDQPFQPRLDAAEAKLHRDHPELAAVTCSAPHADFERLQSAQDPWHGYRHRSHALNSFLARVPIELQGPWLASLIIWHLRRFDQRFAQSGLDLEFVGHYTDSYHRILDQIAENPAAATLDADVFMKDLGLARQSLIPAVAQLLYLHSGLSLRPVLRAGPAGWNYVWRRCGGRRPMLEIHTHGPMAAAFSTRRAGKRRIA